MNTNSTRQVYGEIEPHNPVDKYAVAVKKDEKVIGHLLLGENGKFAKTIFYILCADRYAKCNIGKAVNRGDGDGTQPPVFYTYQGKSPWWRY